ALGRLADDDFIVLGERDDRRRGAVALAVLDDPGLAALHEGHAGIGGPEVDADYLSHDLLRSITVRSDKPLCGAPGQAIQALALETIPRAGRSSRPLSS